MKLTGVRIDPGSQPRVVVFEGTDAEVLAQLQAAVGGYVEPVRVRFDCLALVDEDGRVKDPMPPVNAIASALAHREIVGPMVVLGPSDGSEFGDAPESVVSYLTTL